MPKLSDAISESQYLSFGFTTRLFSGLLKKRQIVVLLQVDGLRHDYLNKTDAPFLYGTGSKSISGILQPTFGFEPDGAYLAGLYPDQCDGGAHYWYQPESSPFGLGRCLPERLDRLPPLPKRILRRPLTEWVRRTTAYKYASVVSIPLSVLPYVAPAHSHLPWEPGYSDSPTIFSLCDEHDMSWLVHAAPSHPVQVEIGVERLKRDLKPPTGFAFWHIGDLDKTGHRYGPHSAERKAAMRRVDAGIREVSLHLESSYDQVSLVVIGDHGMAEVRRTLDVQGALSQRGLRQGQGVLYFLDSTMARFWFFEEWIQRETISILESLDEGEILTQEALDRYHLNYPHNRFGDVLFLADPGVLISPNFYQGDVSVRGMHGYAPECPEQQSGLIVHCSGSQTSRAFGRPVDMRRVFPTILELLGLDRPPGCSVESFL